MKERIYLASPHMGMNELAYVKNAFETNWVAPLGPYVDSLEKVIADYVGVKGAAALSSGTAAIHLALKAARVGTGDIVFCSSLTFAASCNPILYEKAIPVFIDSEPNSWNMSPRALERAFEKYGNKVKAVIVVNLYGQEADMDAILEICNHYEVPVIEDAAESLGAIYKGKKSGSLGTFGAYSFNGNKIITTSGGGMLVSNNEAAVQKVRFWATQSREKQRYYHHKEIGYNYRMSNICAAIGMGQMEVLEERIAKKKVIYETYKAAFKDISAIKMMPICKYGSPNYWLSVITLENKVATIKPIDVISALEAENIESRYVWKPMHLQPIFKKYEFYSHNEKVISVGEEIFNKGVCLPSDTKMNEEQIQRVIKIIKAVVH